MHGATVKISEVRCFLTVTMCSYVCQDTHILHEYEGYSQFNNIVLYLKQYSRLI
jgi:hypothetical protein